MAQMSTRLLAFFWLSTPQKYTTCWRKDFPTQLALAVEIIQLGRHLFNVIIPLHFDEFFSCKY
jgi:hypothetical protein